MGKCNSCGSEKPDILRGDYSSEKCGETCQDCTEKCGTLDEKSDCPYGQMADKCVVYTGIKTFISQLRPGMTIYQVINAFENTFETVDRLIERLDGRIRDLEDEVEELKDSLGNGNGCDNYE